MLEGVGGSPVPANHAAHPLLFTPPAAPSSVPLEQTGRVSVSDLTFLRCIHAYECTRNGRRGHSGGDGRADPRGVIPPGPRVSSQSYAFP